MTYWQEDTSCAPIADDVLDLAFAIQCRALPVDHAWALSQALQEVLLWWNTEPLTGLHMIHGGESGNGWQRPAGGADIMYLTRRAKLTLRLPRTRLVEARSSLQGRTLMVAGAAIVVGEALERPLSHHSAMYARHVVVDQTVIDEENFLADVAQKLQKIAVRFKKILPGKSSILTTPSGPCITRSLLVADLSRKDAVELQRHGLGPQRFLGCGLFIPHKTLNHV